VALEHVAGFALHNDYSGAIPDQRGGQWTKGKSADGCLVRAVPRDPRRLPRFRTRAPVAQFTRVTKQDAS
jgi:2-keto-4-pentenoate hydratase/2-oxohepta-3-ene-1,7-dioic acid hydratase in catechol pathway